MLSMKYIIYESSEVQYLNLGIEGNLALTCGLPQHLEDL